MARKSPHPPSGDLLPFRFAQRAKGTTIESLLPFEEWEKVADRPDEGSSPSHAITLPLSGEGTMKAVSLTHQ
jgi:hypothetical protein